MQSGVISPDNLADILRGISQRRRQGVLEIQTTDGAITIRFIQGRVVDAFTHRLSAVQETVEWLHSAGYPVRDPKQYSETKYSDLFATLSAEITGASAISAALLAHVIKHRVLERLYKIDVGLGSLYTFKVQMVENEGEYAPAISVGQLLLDLVELSSETEHFEKKFPDSSVIRALVVPSDVADADEAIVVRAIGAGCGILELERRSLLSSYHFRHALLQLLENARIEVLAGGRAMSSQGEMDAFLSQSVDAAFPEGMSVANESSAQGTLEQLVADEEMSTAGTVSRAASLQMTSALLLQSSAVPRILGVGFLLIAVFAPLLLWRSVLAAFSE